MAHGGGSAVHGQPLEERAALEQAADADRVQRECAARVLVAAHKHVLPVARQAHRVGREPGEARERVHEVLHVWHDEWKWRARRCTPETFLSRQRSVQNAVRTAPRRSMLAYDLQHCTSQPDAEIRTRQNCAYSSVLSAELRG